MCPHDILDVASYITVARSFYGRDEINKDDLAVDNNLNPAAKGKCVIIFQRKDTGKTVKVIFNRSDLISPEQGKSFQGFFEKMMSGKASTKEKEEKWEELQSMVKTVLLNIPAGLFEIIQLKQYTFPKSVTNEDK